MSSIIFFLTLYLFTNFFPPAGSIESYIRSEKVNKNCILITFGADAVAAINTMGGIVVIDAGVSTGLTKKYRKIIEKEFGRKKILYLINTHGHHDHTGGNTVFADAKIAAHFNCGKEIKSQWKDISLRKNALIRIVKEYEVKLASSEKKSDEWKENFCQRNRYFFASEDSEIPALPEITFTDSLKLIADKTIIELYYAGKSHSESDILIFIPQHKILFTGDLFSGYGRPGFDPSSADISRLKVTFEWLEKRIENIDFIISGHGWHLTKADLKSFLNKRFSQNGDN